MSDNESKRKQAERHLRQVQKHVGYEEQKRRKSASQGQHSTRSKGRARQHTWSEDDEEAPALERIVRRPQTQASARIDHGPIDASLPRSTVIAVHRGRFVLEGEREARLAGRLAVDPDLQLSVGDEVAWSDHSGIARIEGVVPRRSRLARADPGNPHRELVIAANVDVAVVVAAAVDPPLRPGLIDRFLLGLEHGGVGAVVCINKVDLLTSAEARDELELLLRPYIELGLPIVRVSANTARGLDDLRAEVSGRTCVFVGHSGVGKSSLLNALDPTGERPVGAVREHRGQSSDARAGRGGGRGRHTTTSSSLRDLGDDTRIIDTPGVRSFGIEHLTPAQVLAGFPDLLTLSGDCRYTNCLHGDEPDCAVLLAIEEGRLSAARHASFRRVLGEV